MPLLIAILAISADTPVRAQSGSVGGSVGQTDKSVSGAQSVPATRSSSARSTVSNSLTGLWSSNLGVAYQIKQSGRSFTWISGTEVAHGTISGDTVQASWSGRGQPGSGTGRIGKDRLVITWDNGVVMVKQ